MMIKVWLDDERNPLTFGLSFTHPTLALKVLNKCGRDGWIWVKNIEDAKVVLIKGNVDVLSCDNDLGEKITEGYLLLNWLEEKAALELDFPIPNKIYAHSANMDRIIPMQQTIESIERLKSSRG